MCQWNLCGLQFPIFLGGIPMLCCSSAAAKVAKSLLNFWIIILLSHYFCCWNPCFSMAFHCQHFCVGFNWGSRPRRSREAKGAVCQWGTPSYGEWGTCSQGSPIFRQTQMAKWLFTMPMHSSVYCNYRCLSHRVQKLFFYLGSMVGLH